MLVVSIGERKIGESITEFWTDIPWCRQWASLPKGRVDFRRFDSSSVQRTIQFTN